MTRRQIQNELTHRHIAFAEYILSLDKADFNYSYQNRWTAGQQLSHIVKSTAPVLFGLRLPPFAIKMMFGSTDRASDTYQEIVKSYKHILERGGKSSRIFLPGTVSQKDAPTLKSELLLTISKINLVLEKIPEASLDIYRLPHPLLGK